MVKTLCELWHASSFQEASDEASQSFHFHMKESQAPTSHWSMQHRLFWLEQHVSKQPRLGRAGDLVEISFPEVTECDLNHILEKQ
jgi:hypothetical protein